MLSKANIADKFLNNMWAEYFHDYDLFLKKINEQSCIWVSKYSINDIKNMYPNEDDEFDYLLDYPDVNTEKLVDVPISKDNWVNTNSLKSNLVLDVLEKSCSSITNIETREDIIKSSHQILSRCENPKNWKQNKRGLVFGMVQSGKTVSMINTISLAIENNYKLFIILAGDKNSLRNQTQERIDDAFANNSVVDFFLTSKKNDFNKEKNNNPNSISSINIVIEETKKSPVFIAVIKKEKKQLEEIYNYLKEILNEDIPKLDLPCLIIDDESDFASIDTSKEEDLSTEINFGIEQLYNLLPKACYIGYTATPQSCFLAKKKSFNYPKDFIWLLEPTYKKNNIETVSYMGGSEFFFDYQNEVVNVITDYSWPQYIKNSEGKVIHIRLPDKTYVDPKNLESYYINFADKFVQKPQLIPNCFFEGFTNHILGTAIRWSKHFNKTNNYYSKDEWTIKSNKIDTSNYPHHAMMINLSGNTKTHKKIRLFIEEAYNLWSKQVETFLRKYGNKKYDFHTISKSDNLIENNLYHLKKKSEITEDNFWTVLKFIIKAYHINKHKIDGEHFVYIINSNKSQLQYSGDPKEQTKKSSIIIGGNILSRGLTIEGLCTSIYIRSQQESTQDTNLQVCRWFGHRKNLKNYLKLYITKESLKLFKDITDSDNELRAVIKSALLNGLNPGNTLIEMQRTNFFRTTSRAKSRHAKQDETYALSGTKRLQLNPIFKKDIILKNTKCLKTLLNTVPKRNIIKDHLNGRGDLYKNIDFYKFLDFLNDYQDYSNSENISTKEYKKFLTFWSTEGVVPNINIGISNRRTAQRVTTQKIDVENHTINDIKCFTENKFKNFSGGSKRESNYLGDLFFDQNQDFHSKNIDKTQSLSDLNKINRTDILFMFYEFDVNYIGKRKFPGKTESTIIRFKKNEDKQYIDLNTILTFMVATPYSGPKIKITTHVEN